MPNWTKKQFTVSQAVPDRSGTKSHVAKLVDYIGEAVKISWYSNELQEILDNQYRIEKGFQRRTLSDGTKELFVKCEFWPKTYNSWIKERNKYDVVGE